MESFRIGTTDVILQDYEDGKGKIIISDDDFGYDFSYYWGAMGENTNLKKFITSINSDYFVNKLGPHSQGPIDSKRTMRNVRRFIREEMDLPWYKHLEFQKDMREKLNDFQNEIYTDYQFAEEWNSLVDYRLDYYLIEDRFDREEIESAFKGICEQWYFIEYETHPENVWLNNFHKKLVKYFNKKK
jgi:hypothetical protein